MKNKKYPDYIKSSYKNILFKYVDDKLKTIILKIFENINDHESISIEKMYLSKRRTIKIKYNNKIKYILLLENSREIIKEEHILSFINTLKALKIEKESIDSMLLFHWSDGTLNNTGNTRYKIKYFYEKYPNRLILLNKELNKKNNLKNILKKHIFFDDKKLSFIDYIIYKDGDEHRLISSSDALDKMINYKGFDNLIHLGPIIIHNKKRNLIKDEKSENQRSYIKLVLYDYQNIFNEPIL